MVLIEVSLQRNDVPERGTIMNLFIKCSSASTSSSVINRLLILSGMDCISFVINKHPKTAQPLSVSPHSTMMPHNNVNPSVVVADAGTGRIMSFRKRSPQQRTIPNERKKVTGTRPPLHYPLATGNLNHLHRQHEQQQRERKKKKQHRNRNRNLTVYGGLGLPLAWHGKR